MAGLQVVGRGNRAARCYQSMRTRLHDGALCFAGELGGDLPPFGKRRDAAFFVGLAIDDGCRAASVRRLATAIRASIRGPWKRFPVHQSGTLKFNDFVLAPAGLNFAPDFLMPPSREHGSRILARWPDNPLPFLLRPNDRRIAVALDTLDVEGQLIRPFDDTPSL